MERTAKEQERIEKELAEKERLENERLVKEKEQLEKERAEKERLENERIRENERLEKERAEKEKSDKEIADKLKADQERAENLKADRERAEKMMADREAKLNAEQEKNSKPKVVFKPPPVFASGGQDAARDSATFREFNIIDPNNFTAYPKKVKVVFRPIFEYVYFHSILAITDFYQSKDPLDVVFLHTDQPGQKFRRALNQYLGPKDTKYLMGLESVIAFIDNATNRFYDNVGSIVF